MNTIKKSFKIIFLFSFLLCSKLQAQTVKAFTSDSVKFLSEMTTFFVDSKNKDAENFMGKEFKKFWYGGNLTQEKKDFIYKIANAMLKKKMRPFPDFQNFLLSIMNFHRANLPEQSFKSWQLSVEKIAAQPTVKKLSSFMEASNLLFGSNTLYKSNSVEWTASNSNYSFEYDSLPKVIFPALDLMCIVKADTALINNTHGVFYPTEDKWVGNGGKVTWIRTGVDENTIYAELKKYNVSLKTQGYKADSVVFYNKIYFAKPLMGALSDKAVPDATPNNAVYPKFESYNKRFLITGLADKNVDFDGGFSMSGSKFLGSGSKDEDAYLIFKRNNKKFLVAASKTFVFRKDKVSSDLAAVTIYLDKDSVYHPGLQMQFNIPKKELILIRTNEGISKSPYFNTYHNVDMYFEELNWKLDLAKIDFKTLIGSAQGTADFESSNYFKTGRFVSLQGIDEINPLTQIKDYVNYLGGKLKEFPASDLAGFMRHSVDDIRPMLVRLANGGFIIYDLDDDFVYVKERLFEYIKAQAGKIDYDGITFNSEVAGGAVNAILNLLNNDLRIRGISQIALSDSQKVYIYPDPKKREIILKKNRNFTFEGAVAAGRFEFFGKEFSFEYDKFKINLTNVDSLRLKVKSRTPNANGEYPLVRVKTVLEHINGDLEIDHPKNKSGLHSSEFQQYPIFNSKKDSYVFYNKRAIQRGVYNKDKFYFHLDPFTIDSLDNFANEGLRFNGDFVSADIFPQFRETLTLQKDYSLGFIRNAPPDGFAMYGTKGNYKNQIRLSHEGLRGDGEIAYLTSITKSPDFIFFPDSMNTHATNFSLNEERGGKSEYPSVSGDTTYVHWLPQKDLMQVHKEKKPIRMYNDSAKFHGRLDLTPLELTGKGRADFTGSELEANKMSFKAAKFTSDTADFRLKALADARFAFKTTNVNALIDFGARMGEFKSNGKGTVVTFPVNQYICYMDKFKWFMDSNSIELSSDKKSTTADAEALLLSGPEFISIHPKQDSLRFFAPSAKFDLKKNIIHAKDVKYINVADARILPDSGNVTIEREALMKTFINAKIVANNATKYHTLYNAIVNVTARKNYSASGDYDYVDEIKQKQTIHFASINIDTTYQTYAEANIPDSMHFALSPNFEFKGTVKMEANKQHLAFNGACRMQHACAAVQKSWFKFTEEINPERIYIPVGKDLYDVDDKHIAAGIMLTTDSTHIYSTFLSQKNAKNDTEVLPADGYLFYDKPSKEYRISNKEKLIEKNLTGNYISLNINSCKLNGEGKMNLGVDLGQVKIETVGSASHNLISDSAAFDVLMAVDFFFDNNALDKLSDAINADITLEGVDFGRATYEKGLRELVGKDKADKLISQLNLYQSFRKFPDELEHTIFFNQLKLKWNTETKSYISQGKIGVSNIRKNQVNKLLEGKIEIKKLKGGRDMISIYLEIDESNWYYFTYTQSYMQAYSKNDAFNKSIIELKDDKRENAPEKGQARYKFGISSEAKKIQWLKQLARKEKDTPEDK